MFSFFVSFLFYLTLVGDSQKGKRKTSEQGVLSDSNTRSERQKRSEERRVGKECRL